MSDCVKTAFSFLYYWKIGHAISVVGLGVTCYYFYYYYLKKFDKDRSVNCTTVVSINVIKDVMESVEKRSEEYKNQENAEFALENYDNVVKFYSMALSKCSDSKKKLTLIVYQSRVAAYNQLRKYQNCIFECDNVLILKLRNKKMSRKKRALVEIGKYELFLENINVLILLDELQNETYLLFAKYNIKKINIVLKFALKCFTKKYNVIVESCIEELDKTGNDLIRRNCTLDPQATISITMAIVESSILNKLIINPLIKRALIYVYYHQAEKVKKLFEDFKRVEKIDSYKSGVFRRRAQIYFLKMNHEKAIEEFKRAIKLNPKFGLSYIRCCYAQYNFAKQKSNVLDTEIFLKNLSKCMIKYPNIAENYILYTHVKVLFEKESYKEADSLFEKVHDMYPENANFIVYRALVLLSRKNSTIDAFNYLEKALKIDPKCKSANFYLGSLYIQTKQYKKGIEYLEKTIPLTKDIKELSSIFLLRDLHSGAFRSKQAFGILRS